MSIFLSSTFRFKIMSFFCSTYNTIIQLVVDDNDQIVDKYIIFR